MSPRHNSIARGCLLASVILGLAGCGTPPPAARRDTELDRQAALARGAFADGATEKAADHYQRALERARLADDPAAIGANAYNLAACLAQLRQDAAAAELLSEADSAFQRTGAPAGEIVLLQARLKQRAGDPAAALALLQARLAKLSAHDRLYVQLQMQLADLHCDLRDAAAARAALGRLSRKTLAREDWTVQAEAERVRGRLALLEQKFRPALNAFDDAARAFQAAGQYEAMAAMLAAAADAARSAGETAAALDRYTRAIRSLLRADQPAAAARLLDRATPLAAAAEPSARAGLDRLQAELAAAHQELEPVNHAP